MSRRRRLVEILVELGVLTRKTAAEVVDDLPNHPGQLSGDLLVEKGLCTEDQVKAALAVQREAGSTGLLMQTMSEAARQVDSARASIAELGDLAESVAKK